MLRSSLTRSWVIKRNTKAFHSSPLCLAYKQSAKRNNKGYGTKIAFALGCVAAYFLNRYYDEHKDFSVIQLAREELKRRRSKKEGNSAEQSAGDYWKVNLEQEEKDNSVKEEIKE